MTIGDIMTVRLVQVPSSGTVQAAVERMAEENVGSVVVCDDAKLAGIFTERDVLRLAARERDFDAIQVGEVMTRNVVVLSPADDIVAAARVMGERRVRHLPVVEGEHVLGIVGIREVLGALTERLWRSRDPDAHDTVQELLARSPRSN